jgi:hypothetical protein
LVKEQLARNKNRGHNNKPRAPVASFDDEDGDHNLDPLTSSGGLVEIPRTWGEEAAAEPKGFQLMVEAGPAQATGGPRTLVLKLMRYSEAGLTDRVSHAIANWATPSGQISSVSLLPIDDNVWASLMAGDLTDGTHQVRVAILVESIARQVDRLVELEYDLELPTLQLRKRFQHELGEMADAVELAAAQQQAAAAHEQPTGLTPMGAYVWFLLLNMLACALGGVFLLIAPRLSLKLRERLMRLPLLLVRPHEEQFQALYKVGLLKVKEAEAAQAEMERFDDDDADLEKTKGGKKLDDHAMTELLIEKLQGDSPMESSTGGSSAGSNRDALAATTPLGPDEKEDEMNVDLNHLGF